MSALRVTVLMPVYNGARYLREAMESILGQTFTDFEFLIINDGSTDSSVAIIESYTDPRIRLIHNDSNLGLIDTLNRGIELAKGEYIARMDCDDVSMPERLAKQIGFMGRHTDVGVCGTWISMIGRKEVAKPPIDHDEIVCRLMFESSLLHPTVIIRRCVLWDNGLLYDQAYSHAEDYELWVRCSKHCKLANIGEVLLHYRIHPDQVSEVYSLKQLDCACRVKLSQLEEMGIIPTPEEATLHHRIWPPGKAENKQFLIDSEKWLMKLRATNAVNKRYRAETFDKELIRVWFSVCVASTGFGLWTLNRFFKSSLTSFSTISVRQIFCIVVYYIIAKKRT